MVHTLPDYTTKYKTVKVFGNLDHAELAARLGSIDTFDRRGSIVFIEDFEGPTLKWEHSGTGTGNMQTINTKTAMTGSTSCLLRTGDTTGDEAQINKTIEIYTTEKIGIEFSFSPDINLDTLDTTVYIYTGVKRLTVQYQYRFAYNTIRINTANHGWVTKGGSIFSNFNLSTFTTIKMVIDLIEERYTRMILARGQINLTDYTLTATANPTNPSIAITIKTTTNTNANSETYIDNFILTQNEP